MAEQETGEITDKLEYPPHIQRIMEIIEKFDISDISGSASVIINRLNQNQIKFSVLEPLEKVYKESLSFANDFPGREIVEREYSELAAFSEGVRYALTHAKLSIK